MFCFKGLLRQQVCAPRLSFYPLSYFLPYYLVCDVDAGLCYVLKQKRKTQTKQNTRSHAPSSNQRKHLYISFGIVGFRFRNFLENEKSDKSKKGEEDLFPFFNFFEQILIYCVKNNLNLINKRRRKDGVRVRRVDDVFDFSGVCVKVIVPIARVAYFVVNH